MNNGYTIFPLGDSAATIDLGNTINEILNDKIIAMQHWLLANSFTGQKDIIVAYSSLTIIYDPNAVKLHYRPGSTIFEWVKEKLSIAFNQSTPSDHIMADIQHGPPLSSASALNPSAIIRIPVCYAGDFAPDLYTMALDKQMDPLEIIALHTSAVYRVYTIGFLPGFSYMAEVHEKLITPRKAKPVPVAAGSVGIAGAQTGIYPLESPGGWHIIGRTPIKQFDANTKELVKLKVGDRVQFYAISEEEYENVKHVENMINM